MKSYVLKLKIDKTKVRYTFTNFLTWVMTSITTLVYIMAKYLRLFSRQKTQFQSNFNGILHLCSSVMIGFIKLVAKKR